MTGQAITIDATAWPRLVEVYSYSVKRGITLDEAVEELVNKGLSHT